MNIARIVKTAVVAGVVWNVVDFVVMRFVLGGYLASMPIINQGFSMVWNVAIDFVFALVFVMVFERVRGSFGPGMTGGLTFGLFAGLLVHFPTWIGMHLMMTGFSYANAWVFTCYGVVMWTVLGALVGWAYDLGAGSPAAATA